MLVGSVTFEGEEDQEMYKKILNVNVAIPKFVKQAARVLIEQLEVRNPEKRLALDKVLTHRWMVRNCPPSE